jgi:teichuronic acid exporter
MNIFRLAIWDFSGRLANYLVLFVTSIVLTRILEPADYGAFGIVISVFAVSAVFLDFGFRSAIIQSEDISQVQLSTVFYFNVAIAAIIAILITLFSGLLQEFYQVAGLAAYLTVTSAAFILNGANAIPSGLLQRDLKFRQITTINIVAAIFASATAVALAISGHGIWSLIGSQLVNAAGLMLGCFIATKWHPGFLFALSSVKPLWKYGSNLFGSGLLDAVYSRLDAFIVPKMFGIVAFGYYSRSQSLEGMVRGFCTSTVMSVIFPVFSRNQRNVGLGDLYIRALHLICIAVFAVTGVLVLTAHDLIVILFTEKWIESVNYFRILSITTFIYPVSAVMVYLIAARGNSRMFLKLEIIKKALLTPAYLFFLFAGIYGFLIAITVANLFCLTANALFVAKETGIPAVQQIRIIGLYAGTAVLAFAAGYSVRTTVSENVYLQFSFGLFTYQAIYFLLNYLLRTPGFNELLDKLSTLITPDLGQTDFPSAQ